MTAPSSKKLALVLRAAGFEFLAKRAELDEFHDFKSPHDLPSMVLDTELMNIIMSPSYSQVWKDKAKAIRAKHHNGEFDADLAESDEWAKSAEGQHAFNSLVGNA